MNISKNIKNPLLLRFASVGAIQSIALLLPLLTIPYLLVVLGESGFALVNIALAVCSYFVVLVDYGFNLMGTRLVALHRDNPEQLNRIFSGMLYAQLVLTALAIVVFSLLLLVVPQYRAESTFFFATFGIVLGSTLLPTWLFQGMEKLNALHLIMLAYKGLYTLLIFTLVKGPEHLMLVPLFNSSTAVAGGLFGLLYGIKRYRLRFISWQWAQVRQFLREGWNLFVSSLSVTSMQQLPLLVLAFFAQPFVVAYYALADKVLLALRIGIQLLSTLLYPRIIQASKSSLQKVLQQLSRLRRLGFALCFPAALLIFFTPDILAQFFPKYYSPALQTVLRIWSLLPFLLFLRMSYQQLLLTYDWTKSYARALLGGAALNVLLLLVLGNWSSYTGIAWAVVLTELTVLAFFMRSSKLKIQAHAAL